MSFSADREEVTRGARAALLLVELDSAAGGSQRSREGRGEEAQGLALAIGLECVAQQMFRVRKANPATLIGSGQVDSFAHLVEDNDVVLTVVDAALTPIQQRNLETRLGCKVIDRTALILEIFGERAATAEGRMQVELAHLDYQQGRLVRSWTHLERQRGGFGFLGGPGETQIEADRRLIRDRMARIRKQLEDVKRTRTLHRERRRKAPWPVVALVGYTNAGKSTLFNRMTNGGVLAEDMLFATLDPTMRAVQISGVGKVIVSDTVGFVSDLPTQLVAAFRATLEEVTNADLLLHVRDISHPDSDAQKADVLSVLADLGVAPHAEAQDDEDSAVDGPDMIEVFNKIDLLPEDDAIFLRNIAERQGAVMLSAETGEGMDALAHAIATRLMGRAEHRSVTVSAENGRLHAWIAANCAIQQRTELADGAISYDLEVSPLVAARLDGMLAASDG